MYAQMCLLRRVAIHLRPSHLALYFSLSVCLSVVCCVCVTLEKDIEALAVNYLQFHKYGLEGKVIITLR